MQTILNQLKIGADVIKVENNGTMSKYYLRLHPGAKVSKIENCATEIALGLKAYSKPIIRVITEEGLVVVELLTNPVGLVKFSEITNKNFNQTLPMILGRIHDGDDLIVDLVDMPHLLIAGTTGSGKSVLLHSILSSLIMSNKNIKFALIDPKKVELSYYSNIKQLMYPVTTNPDDALNILSDLVDEMESRFKKMSKVKVNSVNNYNKIKSKKLPYIILVIDEFSSLVNLSKKIFLKKLCALVEACRAAGIHIIMSTQHPSVDIVSGPIKANFPARIGCRVSSLINSRVILDMAGAEKLLGRGDALIKSNEHELIRFQGAYISPEDINILCENNKRGKICNIINYIKGVY